MSTRVNYDKSIEFIWWYIMTRDLFDDDNIIEREWREMPEFIQHKQRPYSKITIRFSSEQDLLDFADLIGQKLTKKTKSIWFPFRSHWGNNTKVWK